jgi:gamma-glutamylcysteine synthetase
MKTAKVADEFFHPISNPLFLTMEFSMPLCALKYKACGENDLMIRGYTQLSGKTSRTLSGNLFWV